MKKKQKKVVVVGGGTGTYTALLGLKKYDLDISAVVSMMDSGGSNRIIRDEFGLLPTSDIRQCIMALSDENGDDNLRKLFTYRYESGTGISGMTFGNLFMAALTDIYGTQEEAIERSCKLLGVAGEVIPVTYDDSHLVARYDNGKQVLGEHYIDEPDKSTGKHRIVELEAIPKAKANKKAIKAISNADLIILGPGDLYTSVISNFVVDGISGAISGSSAKKVFVLNLMTTFGQTNEYSASEHLIDLEKYLGESTIDICLVNKSTKISSDLLNKYKEEGSEPVVDDLGSKAKWKVVRRSFLSNEIYRKSKSDKLRRSLIRHDSNKLAKAITSLL